MNPNDMNAEENKQLQAAEEIIRKHTMYSMGGALIPIPLIDLAAVTAIQLDMVKQLANLYGSDYSEDSGKALVGALTGNLFARMGASLLKSIPGIGSLLGGVSLVVLSGGATYALGNVFLRHVRGGGTLFDMDPEDYKQFFRERYEEGKQKAEEWKEEAQATAKDIEVEFDQEDAGDAPESEPDQPQDGDDSPKKE